MSGTRQGGLSISAQSGGYTGSLNKGIDRFTTLLHGGFDGTDITERDPFRNSATAAGTAEVDSSKLHSIKRAINIISDTDQVQFNVAVLPGITQPDATDYLLEKVEERGDALAIIDLEKIYTPDTESTASASARNAFTIKQATDALKARNINNSYGAAYAPWVQIQDTISNRLLWVPPSVVALGALSSNDRIAAPWFAPAGFTRGGLSEGAGGIPVLDVTKRLSSDDRDDLYEANINPIAKFPAEGIVIFGQKTLQQTRSALDRINVRRLLVFLKREISFIASRLLFAQNTQDTWNRFLQQATPVLEGVKSQFGIDDFRLILDETTTTPDLVDRNIIYSKLIVKPTRSAEFFAIDFVITNSGASFED
jgi:phage tail sheath protein FI